MIIGSLNIRVASNAEEHEQGIREPRIISFIQTNKPDSIGTQECTAFWRERLDERMAEIGYRRAQNTPPIRNTFKNYIWYRTETIELVDAGINWLSETPKEPSRGFGSKFYISAAWAVFRSKEDGTEYVHINTHLDVTDENIRKAEMELVLAMVKGFTDKGYEVLVTGDFNAREESVIYDGFTAVLADARKTAKHSTEMNTFNGYQRVPGQYRYDVPESEYIRIDFCFYTDKINVEQFSVIDRWDGGYMSDHNALLVQISSR